LPFIPSSLRLMKRVSLMKAAFLVSNLLLTLLIGSGRQAIAQSRPDTVPVQLSHYNSRLALFRKAPAIQGKIMFLGDDVIERGNWRRMLKDSSIVQRGISGDNTFGVLNRLDEATRFKPSNVFVHVGANDLARGVPVARVMENLFALVGQLHARVPSAQVVLMGMLPVNSAMKNFPTLHARDEEIRELNSQLKKYKDVIKYTFVDVYTPLLDQQNALNATLTTDGVHLNPAGYQVLMDHLKNIKP